MPRSGDEDGDLVRLHFRPRRPGRANEYFKTIGRCDFTPRVIYTSPSFCPLLPGDANAALLQLHQPGRRGRSAGGAPSANGPRCVQREGGRPPRGRRGVDPPDGAPREVIGLCAWMGVIDLTSQRYTREEGWQGCGLSLFSRPPAKRPRLA